MPIPENKHEHPENKHEHPEQYFYICTFSANMKGKEVEEMNQNKSLLGKITDIIIPFMILYGLVVSIHVLITAIQLQVGFFPIFQHAVMVIAFVAVICYSTEGYKKAHGNELRYTMLVCAFLIEASALTSVQDPRRFISSFVEGLAALLIAYCAGRLDKLQKNKVVLTITALLLLGAAIANAMIIPQMLPESDILVEIGSLDKSALVGAFFDKFLLMIGLGKAYSARFIEHKEAGEEEDRGAKRQ